MSAELVSASPDFECENIVSGATVQAFSNCLHIAHADQNQYVMRIKASDVFGVPCDLSINNEEVESEQYQTKEGDLLITAKTQLGSKEQLLSINCDAFPAFISEVSLFDDILYYGEEQFVMLATNQAANILFVVEQAPKLAALEVFDSWDQLENEIQWKIEEEADKVSTADKSSEEADQVSTADKSSEEDPREDLQIVQRKNRILAQRRRLQESTESPEDVLLEVDIVDEAPPLSFFDQIFGDIGLFDRLTNFFWDDELDSNNTEYIMVTDQEVALSFTWNYDEISADDVLIEAVPLMTNAEPLLFDMDFNMQSGVAYLPVCCDYKIVIENNAERDLAMTLFSETEIAVDEVEEIMLYEPDDVVMEHDLEQAMEEIDELLDEEIHELEMEAEAEAEQYLYQAPIEPQQIVGKPMEPAVPLEMKSMDIIGEQSSSSSSSESAEWTSALTNSDPNQLVMQIAIGSGCLVFFLSLLFCLCRFVSRRYKRRKMALLRQMQTSELSDDQESVARRYWILQDVQATEGPVL